MKRLPTHEDVAWRLTGQDSLQLRLEVLRGRKSSIRAVFTVSLIGFLPLDPVTEIAIGECFKRPAALAVRTRKAVVIHQRVETVRLAIPDVPDERTMTKQLAVFLKELVPEP